MDSNTAFPFCFTDLAGPRHQFQNQASISFPPSQLARKKKKTRKKPTERMTVSSISICKGSSVRSQAKVKTVKSQRRKRRKEEELTTDLRRNGCLPEPAVRQRWQEQTGVHCQTWRDCSKTVASCHRVPSNLVNWNN